MQKLQIVIQMIMQNDSQIKCHLKTKNHNWSTQAKIIQFVTFPIVYTKGTSEVSFCVTTLRSQNTADFSRRSRAARLNIC